MADAVTVPDGLREGGEEAAEDHRSDAVVEGGDDLREPAAARQPNAAQAAGVDLRSVA